MSLGKRLFNIARAEISSATQRVRRSAEVLLEGAAERDDDREATDAAGTTAETGRSEGRDPEMAERDRRGGAGPRTKRRPAAKASAREAQIRSYYANLELPIGASLEEVRAAYRRLMRRYHPDLHQADAEKAAIANKLAQELRTAYEGLLAHLGER